MKYKNYLRLDEFFYVAQSAYEKFIITPEFILNALYIKPDVSLTQENKDKLFFKTGHKKISEFDFKFKNYNIDKFYSKIIDENLENVKNFIDKINKKEVTQLKRLCFITDELSYFKDEISKKIIAVNWVGILEPALNLLTNLMECCGDEEDEIRYYFDYEKKLMYVVWYSVEDEMSSFCMAIKPCAMPALSNEIFEYIQKDLNEIKDFEIYPLIKKD